MRLLATLLVLAAGAFADTSVRRVGLPSGDAQWQPWAPRDEIAPRTFKDDLRYRTRPPSLAVTGNGNASVYGGWVSTLPGIRPGQWYRFTAWYRTEGLVSESLQTVARLDWTKPNGARAGQPEYVWAATREGEWTRLAIDAPAPADAASVKIQLFIQNAPFATVWWDDISLEAIDAPGPRNVRIASLNFRPRRPASPAASVAQFVEALHRAVPPNTDVIVLGETITVIDTGKTYLEVAEPVPGPTTATLGEAARIHKSWLVTSIYEREGNAIYNTAVLIDRQGRLAGKYRKVYLPREEYDGGVTPGSDYPVFRTDFGTVGMMVCWDVQYTDPARALARRGAEIILMPIWGGNETLARARAIENHVFVVASGYGYPTHIIDPDGEIIAAAPRRGEAAVAVIDLNRRYIDDWLGHMRDRFMKEVRVDLHP